MCFGGAVCVGGYVCVCVHVGGLVRTHVNDAVYKKVCCIHHVHTLHAPYPHTPSSTTHCTTPTHYSPTTHPLPTYLECFRKPPQRLHILQILHHNPHTHGKQRGHPILSTRALCGIPRGVPRNGHPYWMCRGAGTGSGQAGGALLCSVGTGFDKGAG